MIEDSSGIVVYMGLENWSAHGKRIFTMECSIYVEIKSSQILMNYVQHQFGNAVTSHLNWKNRFDTCHMGCGDVPHNGSSIPIPKMSVTRGCSSRVNSATDHLFFGVTRTASIGRINMAE